MLYVKDFNPQELTDLFLWRKNNNRTSLNGYPLKSMLLLSGKRL